MEDKLAGEAIIFGKLRWRDAFKYKALLFSCFVSPMKATLGYKILWYLWSADVWFGKFPLLKFIVAANFIVWIILFLTR